ncbi:membrane protein [Mangrovimonas yunxiaonensis]|uniref:Membrane protein n=1 Tax=Mangrovimonas yunxiaonensis TaxID=1197477 RepID=A0A084THV4_9FLAO|nr:YfhO family protein [Mangrovimonas yunxiaonensis]KFB00290.1 membrane protein [Mangrovimonas yunxiaonensis]GGH41517.1 membrane protein [Mangrovimonas yunxiaonensis]
MQLSFKKFLPHIAVLVGFIAISLLYFSPVLQGKAIFQSDIMHYIGMAQQQNDFRAATGEETYWTNSAFGGMPTYQLGAKYPHNYIKKLDLALRFLPRPADYLFLYFIGFYILLLSLKVDFRLSALGALAFGFSTYLIIILGVGHNAKAHAIAYMPLVLSGIILTFRQKYILGFLVTAVGMALELVANHFQMTYYLLFLVLVLGIAYLVDAYKKEMIPQFFKSVGLLVLAVILAIGLNATNIMATQEYAKESTRGQSELTIAPDGSPKVATSGLDRDKITEYSYGFLESLNLYIPRLMGGGSLEDVGKNSASYDFFLRLGATPLQAAEQVKRVPTYWGDQPILEAPAYVGAVSLFLFVFALFLVKGRLKWWLVGGTVLSLLLSYGYNLSVLTNFFIDYVPLYDKFRAVTSIQVILELCIPVLAIFGLVRLFNDFETDDKKLKALKYTVLITGGLALLLLVFKSSFSFSGGNDAFYRQNYGEQFINAIKEDRKAFFTQDTLRTLVLVLLSAGAVFMFLKRKLSQNMTIGVFAALILFDLVVVDRRYVNNENFVPAIKMEKPYQASKIDSEIQQDTSNYRVLDIHSRQPARASYFHNSVSGYHAAKLKRYDELYDFHIARNNIEVLNMLNAKYIIAEGENQQPFLYPNPEANGNAWFVQRLKPVETANKEILALDSLNTKTEAVFNSVTFGDVVKTNFTVDSTATIKVKEYEPNYIKYETSNSNDGFAVFSEVYYKQGWQAFLDGKAVPHIRLNYVLRGMQIPKGNHVVEFRFQPSVVKTGSIIALASSLLFGVVLLGGLFYNVKRKQE